MKRFSLFILGFALVCGTLFADADRHKSGFALQSFGTGGSITNGLMFGFRHVSFANFVPHLYYGWETMMGSARGGRLDNDNLSYAGIDVGLEKSLAKVFFCDVSLVAGYGFGQVNTLGINGGSMVLKPEVAAGLTLIEGFRASFGVGYLVMPSVTGFDALSFTIRFEHANGQEPP